MCVTNFIPLPNLFRYQAKTGNSNNHLFILSYMNTAALLSKYMHVHVALHKHWLNYVAIMHNCFINIVGITECILWISTVKWGNKYIKQKRKWVMFPLHLVCLC